MRKVKGKGEKEKGEEVEEENEHHRPSIPQFLPFEFLWTTIWPFYSHFICLFFWFLTFQFLDTAKGRIPPLFISLSAYSPVNFPPRRLPSCTVV